MERGNDKSPPRTSTTGLQSTTPIDARPRYEAAYEGEDEFSVMSLTPARRTQKKVEIDPLPKGSPKHNEQAPTAWSVIKRFFGR